MKHSLHILTLIFLTFGCKNVTPKKTIAIDSIGHDQIVQAESFTLNEFKSGSVSIDLKNDNFNFIVLLRIGDYEQVYDLKKINIPAKTPELIWINKDYACMLTWWSQSQSRYIFIPTKKTNDFLYFDKDIEETDSINSNIVYIDTVLYNSDKIIFKVENLLTRKLKTFDLLINEKNGIYPYYDKIDLTKNYVTIRTENESKSIDIKEINNGL